MTRYVAEVGPCDDSITYAHELVEAAADTGVWGFKVQMYRADTLTTRTAQRYDRLPGDAANQYDQFRHALPYGAWAEVKSHCDEVDIVFFASVFDTAAVEWCEDNDVPLYKIASGDITHQPLIEAVAATGKPVLFSTGASYAPEVLRASDWIGAQAIPMACSLSYPCRPEDAQVGRVSTLLEHFDSAGYSDHTKGTAAASMAARLGASYIECHFTTRPGTGGDHDFAKTPADLGSLVSHRLEVVVEDSIVHGTGILAPQPSEMAARYGARRGIYAATDLEPGRIITFDDLAFLRPHNDGLEPYQWPMIVGEELTVPMKAGDAF